MKTLFVFGRVIDKNTCSGLPDLHIEVWERQTDLTGNHENSLLSQTLSNRQGNFYVEFEYDQGGKLSPDLFFKIFQGQQLLLTTADSILESIRDSEITVWLKVTEKFSNLTAVERSIQPSHF